VIASPYDCAFEYVAEDVPAGIWRCVIFVLILIMIDEHFALPIVDFTQSSP
jgi:hypothetical protein